MIKDINDSEFTQEVLESDQPVLIDFWAPWCGPCKMLTPVLEQISDRKDIKIVKMNIDDNPETPSSLGIRTIPTMIIYKGGKQVSTKLGASPKSSLEEWINSSI